MASRKEEEEEEEEEEEPLSIDGHALLKTDRYGHGPMATANWMTG